MMPERNFFRRQVDLILKKSHSHTALLGDRAVASRFDLGLVRWYK